MRGKDMTGGWRKLYDGVLRPVIRPLGYNTDRSPCLVQRLRIHMALCLIKYGDSFIFTFTCIKYGYNFRRLVILSSASLRCGSTVALYFTSSVSCHLCWKLETVASL